MDPRTTQKPTSCRSMRLSETKGPLRMTVSVRVRSLAALVERSMAQGSQRDLARRVGVSPTAINLLLQGKRSTVSLDLAARIEDSLDVPRGSLFRFDDLELVGPYACHGIGAA